MNTPLQNFAPESGKTPLQTAAGCEAAAWMMGAMLELMLAELESACLEVVLVPCRRYVNEGGCIRVAANRNCVWYRQFCARHLSGRFRKKSAIDTRIKRRAVVALLNRLIRGEHSRSKYAPEILMIADRLGARERRYA